mmetsp:Transcript_20038/g.24761  ORF Transcript_20038/g.24761 Transcript_20038/m.24761 type:complete len:375 (+) Transcript_20038:37-1161(+)|eukprot:CAMPEP_0172503646 /NCGR_PEP_ID=MMETSP1066-20121228/171105_1 /TAXON_ID=671091 /ORGANISM="Coscinodiscus wailesii, Strain CCMP2513" /LENGTH=374 /DNA_ID=CAMNT_0013279463 /DNA_START=30 /DNA_END=1154 /DNA_ORIENTATION=+
MDTPFEESNLAGIGSDADKKMREAAAKMEVQWEGAGQSPGIQVWRVENKRTDDDTPEFGVNEWPESEYGEFYRGDSYIILQTREDEDGNLFWDIYFWIGSSSTQDEYGVAAYKAVELDDLLGDSPIQHREVEKHESPEFKACFPKGVRYLEGGAPSGFRNVGADSAEDNLDEDIPDRLFQFTRTGGTTTFAEVPCECASLNEGDVFMLDVGDKVFTWFGSSASPFERNKAATLAMKLSDSRDGHCDVIEDVEDDNEEFWSRLGGKGDIAPPEEQADEPEGFENKMYIVSDEDGEVSLKVVDVDKSNLDTNNVCLIQMHNAIIVWLGKESSRDEQLQSMRIVEEQLRIFNLANTTTVYRIKEGQEKRCPKFEKAF